MTVHQPLIPLWNFHPLKPLLKSHPRKPRRVTSWKSSDLLATSQPQLSTPSSPRLLSLKESHLTSSLPQLQHTDLNNPSQFQPHHRIHKSLFGWGGCQFMVSPNPSSVSPSSTCPSPASSRDKFTLWLGVVGALIILNVHLLQLISTSSGSAKWTSINPDYSSLSRFCPHCPCSKMDSSGDLSPYVFYQRKEPGYWRTIPMTRSREGTWITWIVFDDVVVKNDDVDDEELPGSGLSYSNWNEPTFAGRVRVLVAIVSNEGTKICIGQRTNEDCIDRVIFYNDENQQKLSDAALAGELVLSLNRKSPLMNTHAIGWLNSNTNEPCPGAGFHIASIIEWFSQRGSSSAMRIGASGVTNDDEQQSGVILLPWNLFSEAVSALKSKASMEGDESGDGNGGFGVQSVLEGWLKSSRSELVDYDLALVKSDDGDDECGMSLKGSQMSSNGGVAEGPGWQVSVGNWATSRWQIPFWFESAVTTGNHTGVSDRGYGPMGPILLLAVATLVAVSILSGNGDRPGKLGLE